MFSAGLIWEFGAPILKKTSVSDIWDLVCYMVGGVLYWVILTLWNLSNEKRHNQNAGNKKC